MSGEWTKRGDYAVANESGRIIATCDLETDADLARWLDEETKTKDWPKAVREFKARFVDTIANKAGVQHG